MLDKFTPSHFSEYVNTTFRISFGETTTKAELVEINEYEIEEDSEHPRDSSFSLVFRVGKDVPAIQQIYKIEHDKLETFDLFLVPIESDEKGLLLEAVFN